MTVNDPREMRQTRVIDVPALIRKTMERAKELRNLPEAPSGLVYDNTTSNSNAARQKAFLDLAAREILDDEYEWTTLVDFAGRVHLQIKGFKRKPSTDSMYQLRDEFG